MILVPLLLTILFVTAHFCELHHTTIARSAQTSSRFGPSRPSFRYPIPSIHQFQNSENIRGFVDTLITADTVRVRADLSRSMAFSLADEFSASLKTLVSIRMQIDPLAQATRRNRRDELRLMNRSRRSWQIEIPGTFASGGHALF